MREEAGEVIVVDNGSVDGRPSDLGRRAGAVVVRLTKNTGFAGGANAGIAVARGELVALLNDDAIAPPGWLEGAGEVLGDTRVAAVGPKVLLAGRFAEIDLGDESRSIGSDPRPFGRQLFSVTYGGDELLDRLVGPGVHGMEHGEIAAEAGLHWPLRESELTRESRAAHERDRAGDSDRARNTDRERKRDTERESAGGRGSDGTGRDRESRAQSRRGFRWTTGGHRCFYVPLGERVESSGHEASVVVNGAGVAPVRVVKLVNSAGCYLRRDGYAGDIGAETPDDGSYDRPADRFALSGVALVARRETFARLGVFAERFFAYYEDIDWCWRAGLAGMALRYDPTSTVIHARGLTSGGTSAPSVRLLAESNRLSCLARNAPLSLVATEARELARKGENPEVARILPRIVARGLAERLELRSAREITPRQLYEAWAGRDVS